MASLTGNSQQPRQIPEMNKVSVLLLLTATRNQTIRNHKANQQFVEKSHGHALPEKISMEQIFQSKSLQLFIGKGWVTRLLFNCLHIEVWVTNASYVFKKLSICYTVPSTNMFSLFPLSSNLKLPWELKSTEFHKRGFRKKTKIRSPACRASRHCLPPGSSDTELCCHWAPQPPPQLPPPLLSYLLCELALMIC